MDTEKRVLETKSEPFFNRTNDDISIKVEDIHYRMYCVVLKQLSPIQKGIQGSHSICEYTREHPHDKSYTWWVNTDKTLVSLNARSVQDIYDIEKTLRKYNVKYAIFREESLDNIPTSISFILDNSIYEYDQEYDIGDERTYMLRKMIESRRLAN